MSTFASINDALLAEAIDQARNRVVFIAPGVEQHSVDALIRASGRLAESVTLILDSDEGAYRIGYGDPAALSKLHEALSRVSIPVRRQAGIRLGLLVADDQVIVWSPIAQSVEGQRSAEEPNAIVLSGATAEQICGAVGAEGSEVLLDAAEIGREALPLAAVAEMVSKLKENPPAPFDLSRKTRVFSTRYQFVDFEVRGAEWTKKRQSISSFLLNVDLPEALQEILDVKIRPFQAYESSRFKVQRMVDGRAAFDREGNPIDFDAAQSDVEKMWTTVRDRFLRHLKGFGWLVRRDQIEAFHLAVGEYETILTSWVDQFRAHVMAGEDTLVDTIVKAIERRAAGVADTSRLTREEIKKRVSSGLHRMRVIPPKVRVVLKNVAWESTQDDEFTAAMKDAIPADELKGWFEEFTAARQVGDR